MTFGLFGKISPKVGQITNINKTKLELFYKKKIYEYILSQRGNATVDYFAYSVLLMHVFTKMFSKT